MEFKVAGVNINEKVRETLREYFIPVLIFTIIVLIVFTQSPLAPLTGGRIQFDSGVFLYTGWEMAEGYLPYLNSWDNKGPLLYFINMIGIIMNYEHGVWFIEVLFLLTSAVFMYKTFRIFAPKIVSVITVIYILIVIGGLLIGGNFTEEFALPFSYIAVYFFVKYIYEGFNFNKFQLLLLGSTFAATILLRPNIATIWPAFFIVYFFDKLHQKQWTTALRFLVLFLVGAILLILPFAYYLVSNHIFDEFINAAFITPFKFDKPSLQIRLISVLKLLLILNSQGQTMLIAICCLVGSTYFIFRKGTTQNGIKLIYFSTIIAFLLNVYANSLSGRDYVHYAISFIPILSLPTLFVFRWAVFLKAKYKDNNNYFHPIFLVTIVIIILIPSFVMQYSESKKSFNTIDPIENYILSHTTCEDKIQVYAHNSGLYYKTKRQASSEYSYILENGQFDDEFEKLMLETIFKDVMEQRPKVIVLYKRHEDYINETSFEITNKKEYDEYLQNNYLIDTKICDHKIYLRKN